MWPDTFKKKINYDLHQTIVTITPLQVVIFTLFYIEFDIIVRFISSNSSVSTQCALNGSKRPEQVLESFLSCAKQDWSTLVPGASKDNSESDMTPRLRASLFVFWEETPRREEGSQTSPVLQSAEFIVITLDFESLCCILVLISVRQKGKKNKKASALSGFNGICITLDISSMSMHDLAKRNRLVKRIAHFLVEIHHLCYQLIL